jgi:hypothetical protein
MFGNPSTAVSEDVTLTDIANTVWETYHFNLTTAGPQAILVINFTEALVGAINAGNSQWNLITPATTSGPGYSIDLVAYLV